MKATIKKAAKYESKKSLDGTMKFLKGNAGKVVKNKKFKYQYLCFMTKFNKLCNSKQNKQGLSEAAANAVASSLGRKKYSNVTFQKKKK